MFAGEAGSGRVSQSAATVLTAEIRFKLLIVANPMLVVNTISSYIIYTKNSKFTSRIYLDFSAVRFILFRRGGVL